YNNPSQIRIASLPPPDLKPPLIGTPIRNPDGVVNPYQPVKISVNITDLETSVKNATLLYTTDDGANWTIIEMAFNNETGYYEATIPGQSPGACVKFKIIAYDTAENQAIKDDVDPYYVDPIVPEFSTATIFLLLMVASASIVTVCKRKRLMP
ncbi:MAG: hypothetical protein ACPLYF_05015, partial [Fervidobacterium sp.]